MGKLTIKSMTEAELNPVALFEENHVGEVVKRVRKEVGSLVFDVYDEGGRKELKSLAYKVVRLKGILVKCGQAFVAERKAEIKGATDAIKGMQLEFDELRDSIKVPLREWEDEQEKIRTEIEIKECIEEAYELNNQYDADIIAERKRNERAQKEQAQREKQAKEDAKKREQSLIKAAIKSAKDDAERRFREEKRKLEIRAEAAEGELETIVKKLPGDGVKHRPTQGVEKTPDNLKIKKVRKHTIDNMVLLTSIKKKEAKIIYDGILAGDYKYLKVDYNGT